MERVQYKGHSYNVHQGKTEVVAVAKYAGMNVRGVAKCNPEDEFNYEKGKELALARCNAKVAKLRSDCVACKIDALSELIEQFVDTHNKYVDASEEIFAREAEANEELEKVLATM